MQSTLKEPIFFSPNPIGQRLKLEMKKRRITSTELARLAEVKTSFIYDIISGKSANPSTVKLARVAENLGVSLAWLASTGERIDTPVPEKPALHKDYVTIAGIMVDVSAGGTIVSLEQEGGTYYFHRQWIKERLSAEPNNLRRLYVRSDCMEPALCPDDLILVDVACKTPSPPGIFVIFDGFGLVAKRLEHVNHRGESRL